LRADDDGTEISILPSVYPQSPTDLYSFKLPVVEYRSLEPFARQIKSADLRRIQLGMAYDFMRVEQHYARQTSDLDLTFDIDSALFFATNRFSFEDGLAYYERIPRGEHEGAIYFFRFGSLSVKRT
jgi:hypothetical protein